MKGISDLDKIGLVKPQSQGTATDKTDSDLFKNTFEQVLARSETSRETSPTQAASALGEIQSVGFRINDSHVDPLESGTDVLLNKLDTYAKALSDPGRTLKDIEPLLMDIKQEAEQLQEAIQSADQDQNSLKSVAEQSTLLAQVEYQKFIRGDYV